MTTQILRTDGRLLGVRHVARVEPRKLVAGIDANHGVAASGVEGHRVAALLEHLQRVLVVGVREAVRVTERNRALAREALDETHAVTKLPPLFFAIEPRD